MSSTEAGIRLQKALSQAGVASRRQVESMITEGRIVVNGEEVTELGRRVQPGVDVVELDGRVLQLDTERRYLLFHKPTKVVTSLSDEKGRTDLSGVLEEIGERVFPVGRLDWDSQGLLILTNDGDAAQALAHPRFGVSKTYVVTVEGAVAPQSLQRLREGVELEDGPIVADRIVLVGEPRQTGSILEITLHSGRNRIVRRMCEAVGHPVRTLKRTSFGPYHLGGLKPGQWRDFSSEERHQLATLVEASKANTSVKGSE